MKTQRNTEKRAELILTGNGKILVAPVPGNIAYRNNPALLCRTSGYALSRKNFNMADSIVTNYYSPTPAMNVIVYCGVSYDSDLDHVQKVVVKASTKLVAESPQAIHEVEPWFGFEKFGDSNITFWVFIQATDRLSSFALTNDLVKAIHQSLGEAGVKINYPMRKLVLPSDDGRVGVVPPNQPTPGA